MKLASIIDPKLPFAVLSYAQDNNYYVIEIVGEEEFPDLSKRVQECFRSAIDKGCVEFCIHEIRSAYDIAKDKLKWRIALYGFIPKPKN